MLDDRVEEVGDALPCLGRDAQHLVRRDAEHPLDLTGDPVGLRRGQVDLVHDCHDREVVLERQVTVGQRLRLDALRGVDQEHGALAGREAARYLVPKST